MNLLKNIGIAHFNFNWLKENLNGIPKDASLKHVYVNHINEEIEVIYYADTYTQDDFDYEDLKIGGSM